MLPGRVVRCRHDWADDLDPASAVVELPAVESIEESGTCCFARHDDVWVDGPDGAWEIYTVLEDSDAFGQSSAKVDDQTGDSLCCASVPEAEARCC